MLILSILSESLIPINSIERSEAEVGQALGTREYGTPGFAVQRLAGAELQVIYREWSTLEILSSLATNQPVIVFVRTGFLEYYHDDFAHAVVIIGTEEDQRFWLLDPAQPTGPIAVSWNGLLAAWGEFGYRGTALLKKP